MLRIGPGYLLGGVIALLTLLPNTIVQTKVGYAALVVCLLALVLALGSVTPPRHWNAAPTLTVAYLACLTLSTPHYGDLGTLVDAVLFALLAVGTVLVGGNLGARDRDQLLTAVLGVAAFELLVGLAEQFAGLPAPWGYLGRPGSVYGQNNVLPALAGEATGTMGHSIPFGTLMAVAALLCVFARPGWSWRLRTVGAVAFVLGVAISGSRSALIALVAAAVIGVVMPGAFRNAGRVRVTAFFLVLAVAVFGNVQNSTVITSLGGTGSVSHRVAALQSVGRLMGRSFDQMLFGSGFGSTPQLFALRLLQLDNFTAIDNELVSTLALAGLIGLLALVAVFLYGLLAGDRGTRAAVFAIFLMFFSFDLLQWYATAALFFAFVSLGTASGRPASVAGDSVRVPVAQQRR